MTITRTYRCNLCSDTHEPKGLLGLYWKTMEGLVQEAPCAVEHHICAKCLNALRKFKFPNTAGE